MKYEYDNGCCLIPDLISECVLHIADGYGHGIITSAYIHPQEPEHNIFIVIAFDNGRESTYFNLDKLLQNRLISFDTQSINDRISMLRKFAILDLGKRALLFNRQNDAKKANLRVQKYLLQKEAEKKARAKALEKQRLLEKELEEKKRIEERKRRQLEIEQAKIERQRQKEIEEEKKRQAELERQEKKRLDEIKRKKIEGAAQDRLNEIPTSYMLVELSHEDTYIIVCNNRYSNPEKKILFYQEQFARDLLGLASNAGTRGAIKVGKDLKRITFYFVNEQNKDSMLNIPTRSIMIKKNGGLRYRDMPKCEEIISVLLYSPFTKHYELTRGTYNSEEKAVFIDIKLFRKYLHEFGKPKNLDIEFYASKSKSSRFENLNSESILRGYGYTVNSKDCCSHEERITLLKELVDLEIISTRAIVDHLDFCITTHPDSIYSIARSRWLEDQNVIIDYVENPDRFLIPKK